MSTMIIADRYEFSPVNTDENFIGQGGMGTVYLGTDIHSGQPVAIKLLRDVVRQNTSVVERFKREGEVLRQLNHPNIVKMLDACEANDQQYLVMEYVPGGSLRDLLDEHIQLSVQRVLYIALDLADALTRSHRLRILHRDIKPENVLIADDGTPRLTDFGMARIRDSRVTQSGAVVGTLAYLSPESLSDEEIDERADIWSFGVMLFEMLTGRRPFMFDQPAPLINAIMTMPIPDIEELRPEIPTALADLIYRMLERDINGRIPSVRVIGAELEALIRGTPTSIQPVVSVQDTGRFAHITSEVNVVQTSTDGLPPYDIPSQPTTFIGRTNELHELSQLVDDPSVRLITLLGSGGIGKTRIAVALAQASLPKFMDGVFFVPLAPVEDVNYIAPTVAEYLDFTFGGADETESQIISFLREKQLMLVLDNFEHLTDGADFINRIIRDAPHVKVVVTSRERLRLRGEYIYEVQGMLLPSFDTSLDEVMDYPIIRLFLQNAARVLPEFKIDDGNKPFVVRVCHLVNGLPLGIELAATWLESLSIDEIVDEIETSLDFLETDLRDVPDRHRSIRAVFEYSWNLLNEQERDTFARLSMFRGGFEREAAQTITGASLRVLNSLINKSFLQRDPNGRYQVSKLLQQYAEEYFNGMPDCDEIRKKFAVYFAQFIEKAGALFNTQHEPAALSSIDGELENIRAAWGWGIREGQWDEINKLLHSVFLFYLNKSMFREGISRLTDLEKALEEAGQSNTDLFWRVRVRLAWMIVRTGDYDTVERYATGAIAYFDRNQHPFDVAYALNDLSYIHMMRGNYEESIRLAKEAASLCVDFKYSDIWFSSYGNWGYAEYLSGDLVEARRIYEQLLEEGKEGKYSPAGRGYGLNNLGEIVRGLGDTFKAHEMFEEAYNIFKSYNHRWGMAFTLNNLGGVCFVMGRYDKAKCMYNEAFSLNREIGDRKGLGHSLSAMGNVALYSGDVQSAKEYYAESLSIREQLSDKRGIADSLSDMARADLVNENYAESRNLYLRELAIRQENNDKYGEGAALAALGLVSAALEDYAHAEKYSERALEIAGALNAPDMMFLMAHAGLGEVALNRGDYDTARHHFENATPSGGDLMFKSMMLYGLSGLAQTYLDTGELDIAVQLASYIVQQPAVFIMEGKRRAERILNTARTTLSQHEYESLTASAETFDVNQFLRDAAAT